MPDIKATLIHALKTAPKPENGKVPRSLVHVLVSRPATVNQWEGQVEAIWGDPSIYDAIQARKMKPGDTVTLDQELYPSGRWGYRVRIV